MAVVSVTETAESRSGEDSFEKANGVIKITKGFTRSFVVETDNPNDGWEKVRNSLPALNSHYTSGNDTDLQAVCTGRSGDQRSDARKFWDCECEYETNKADASEGGSDVENEDPELRQTTRWSVEFVERAALRDVDGRDIQNAAGDPYDPPAVTLKPVIVINVTRYQRPSSFSANALDLYADSVNEDPFSIRGNQFRAGEAYFAAYEASETVVNGTFVHQVSFVIKVQYIKSGDNPDGNANFSHWDLELLEHGPNYIDGSGNKRPVVDSDSGFRQTANLNKTNGAKLDHDEAPQYTFWRIKPRQSFGALRFL